MSDSESRATGSSSKRQPAPIPSSASRDNDGINLIFDGQVYQVLARTTGDDYIYVRTHALEKQEIGKDRIAVPMLNEGLYEHANLAVRLRINGERVPDSEIRKLPRRHYQALALVAIQLDNEEAGESADFLSIAFSAFPQSRLPLGMSSTETAHGSEESTER